MRIRAWAVVVTAAVLAAGAATPSVAIPSGPARAVSVTVVTADDETTPVAHTGDAADDPAIWVDHADPARSLVIGNDKKGALEVYDLAGDRVQRITSATTFWGNVDVRQDVTVGDRTLDLVMAYNAGIRTFAVDAATHQLVPVGDGSGAIPTGGGEGLCAYHSAATGQTSVFVVTRPGRVRQYVLHDNDDDGLVQGTLVREFQVGSESEGCVADDASGALYVSQEDVALWRYGAEPGDGSTRVMVDAVAPNGNLVHDIEGLAIADTGGGAGYLIASAQNGARPKASYFTVYDRQTNAYESAFRIGTGTAADGCERTDGIAAYAGDLGPAYPAGIFVCQDNTNTTPGTSGAQDFKYTRLERILPVG